MKHKQLPLIHRFLVRFDEKTFDNLMDMATKYKKTKSAVLRNIINKRASNKALNNIEKIGTFNAKALLNLSRYQGNINQIAHQLNLGEFCFDEKEFHEMQREHLFHIKELITELKKSNLTLREVY